MVERDIQENTRKYYYIYSVVIAFRSARVPRCSVLLRNAVDTLAAVSPFRTNSSIYTAASATFALCVGARERLDVIF